MSANAITFEMKAVNHIDVVVIRYSGQATDDQWAAHYKELESLIWKSARKLYIVSVPEKGSVHPTAVQRRAGVDHLKKCKDEYARVCLGWAFVAPTIMHRGILTAILWAFSSHCPTTVAKSESDALGWVEKMSAATK